MSTVIHHEVNLSLDKRTTYPYGPIFLRRGESGLTEIVAHLTRGDEYFDSSGFTATFRAYNGAGRWVIGEASVSGDTATYTVDAQLTEAAGNISIAHFCLTNESGTITTSDIAIIVKRNVDASDVEAEEYQNVIEQMVEELNGIRDTLNESLEESQAATSDARSAADNAGSAADRANEAATAAEQLNSEFTEAEQERVAAEATRVQNETDRSDAESDRLAAEQERIDAEALREKNTKKAVTDAKTATTQAKKATTAANDAAEAATTAASDAATAAQSANQAAESITSTIEDVESKEAERQAAELIRESNEETREENENQRIADHAKRNEQQEANNQAQTANDEAQAKNDLAQAKNNADQAANNQAAQGLQFRILQEGEYDPDSLTPTLEGAAGMFYLVPYGREEGSDLYAEWIWVAQDEHYERVGNTSMSAEPLTTSEVDAIIAGETVSNEHVTTGTALSYYDKARKLANDALYASKTDTADALANKVEQSALDEYKEAQSKKDADQDKAVAAAQTAAEKTAADALQAAVKVQEAKDSEQDTAIQAAQTAADDAAKRIPPIVTTEAPGIVPPIPADANETLYAIHLDEERNAEWIEVSASGGGAADPRELRATIAAATKMHEEAHADVQEDPLFGSWQNTQDAIDALQAAIDAAKAVSDGWGQNYFLQSEFDDANKALKKAIEAFKATGTEAVPNLEEFNALKARVQAVDGKTTVSADGKDVTFGSEYVLTGEKAAAASAVETAQSAVDAATKQRQIDAACDTLEAAATTYEGQVKTAQADNSGIDGALEAAEKAREGVVVSEDGSELEPGSRYVTEQQTIDDIAAAIETATQAKADATTQTMLDDAMSALEAATKEFNSKVQQNLKIPQSSEELEAMSWEEIAQLSAAAAQDPTDFLFFTDAEHKLEKNVPMTGISGVTQVKARIVGVGQDVDENGNKLGLTFQLCDGLAYNQPVNMQMNSSATTSGGWETCLMRTTNLPKIEAALPEELKGLLKPVKKKTNMTASGSTLKETTDKLFLLSYTEVFGDDQAPNSTNTSWCKGEGEWYQWYESHNNNNDRIIKRQDGAAYGWWLRSVYSSTGFGLVSNNGAWSSYRASNSYLPCAGFSV